MVVSTPASTHFELAQACLRAGKHTFVEKPLAMTTAEADDLVALAAETGRTLMVGHTFLYNAAVRYIKDHFTGGELGQLYYIYTQRLNLGQVRSDVNVWWNLAPHDVSILLYLMDGDAAACRSPRSGVAYLQPGIEDVVFAPHLGEPGVRPRPRELARPRQGAPAHGGRPPQDGGLRRRQRREDRRLRQGRGPRAEAGERMDFDHFDGYQILHRTGDVLLPRIDFQEPLKVEASHFLDCVCAPASSR